MRWIFSLLVCVGLSSCAALNAVESVNISPTQVYVAAQAFDAVEATATNYVRLPVCKAGQTFVKNQCSTLAAISRLVPAIHAGRTDRDNLEAYVKANPKGGIGASGLYSALTAATATIKAVFTDVGVAS